MKKRRTNQRKRNYQSNRGKNETRKEDKKREHPNMIL